MDEVEGEASFFREREEVLKVIASVCSEPEWEASFSKSFEYLTLTLGRYQEQPTLLSSSLSDMVSPLTFQLLEILESRRE